MELNFVDTFLENSFVPIYAITLVIVMIRYQRYFDTSLKYFPILILYTFLNELLGVLIYEFDTFSLAFNNLYSDYYNVIYNIYNVVFFAYFLYLFWSYVQNQQHKVLIKYAGLLFLTVSFVNPFFQDIFLEYQNFTFFAGALFLIASVLLYLSDIQKTSQTKAKEKNVLFWIAIGLLIYHVCYFPIKVIRYYNELENITEGPYIRRIHLSLILIMYACFIIGFIKMRRMKPLQEENEI